MCEGREHHPKNSMEGKHKIAITLIERESTQESKRDEEETGEFRGQFKG